MRNCGTIMKNWKNTNPIGNNCGILPELFTEITGNYRKITGFFFWKNEPGAVGTPRWMPPGMARQKCRFQLKWRVPRTLPPLYWSKMDCAPKVCIAEINHEKLRRAGECVRTSAHLGFIRWRKRDAKICRLIGKWRSMLNVGSSFSMCILTHAWALWEDQIRKPKLKKRMLGRVRRNLVNPSIPKMEVLDASF